MAKVSKVKLAGNKTSIAPISKKGSVFKKWWFWTIITVTTALLVTAIIVIALSLRNNDVVESDRQMLSKYYPDFVLSTDTSVRECQLGALRDGLHFVQAYSDRGDSNPARYHYESLAEQCGQKPSDGGNKLLKPILYLYPTKDTNVDISLQTPELVDTSYPKYGMNGWSVLAQPSGDLTDSSGKKYYVLYWDETNAKSVDFSTGFYVTKDNAASFLEDKLSQIGLNDRERNEFIMYWLPKLEHNGQSVVYFELTNERQANNALTISPQPDSLLRINMHMKKVDKPTLIEPQKLTHFERHGFSAVEWGGTEQ